MSGRNEQEYLFQEAMRRELAQGRIDRRDFLTRSLLTGLGLAGVGAVAKSGVTPAFAADRPLTPTVYQWIQDLHPGIPAVNAKFPGINYQIAPVEGFGIERFVAEAKSGESSWDVYVGQTPFVEMSAFIKAGVIEPWDNYIPKDVIDDIIPSIREEGSVDGKLYSWPFLLDVIGSAWHSGITTKAGLPDAAPATWDEFLASSKKIVDSKAAPWGATFDAHGWRSLVPIAHSMSPKVYTPEGLFDFTSEPAIEALKLMKQIMAFSNPDILLEGASDAGVNSTTDEVAWAAQRFHCGCVIFVHEAVSRGRVDAIAQYGARIERIRGNYDDAVRTSAHQARLHGWFVVSDTSYPGYTEIPRDVMQGYRLMADEAADQWTSPPPTHVFIQAGVGAEDIERVKFAT